MDKDSISLVPVYVNRINFRIRFRNTLNILPALLDTRIGLSTDYLCSWETTDRYKMDAQIRKFTFDVFPSFCDLSGGLANR